MEDAIKYRIASPFKTIDKKEEYLPIKLIQETTHSAGLSSGNTVEEAIEKGLYNVVGEELDKKYIETLKKLVLNPEVIKNNAKDLKIVYTPLHGTGNIPVQRILKECLCCA